MIIFLLAYAKSRWRPLLPIVLFAAYLTAVHMITIGSIRYRFPLEPFLIVLGSFTIARLISGKRRPA
jgi:hypothetical protein